MKIVFLLYDKMTALDFVGPHEVLSRLPNTSSVRVAKRAGPINSDSDLLLHADCSLAEIKTADVLLVPGSGTATSLKKHPDILTWIKQIHQTTTWTASVCTGSLILGAAGLLKGKKATTHWTAFEYLWSYGAKPVRARVVEDGKLMSSAGIDMALVLAAKLAGPKFAQTMQLALEYDPCPPFDMGSPDKAPSEIKESLKSLMISRFEK